MQSESILALDVGDKRIGVAVAPVGSSFARPLTTLINDNSFWEQLQALLSEHDAVTIIIGLPRGLNGQETDQTRKVESFVSELQNRTDVPIRLQDEAVTSVKAETELQARGKKYEKSDIDALAATYILEDYLGGVKHV